jgi:hypothetical protein
MSHRARRGAGTAEPVILCAADSGGAVRDIVPGSPIFNA